jgi:hypothetical protein
VVLGRCSDQRDPANINLLDGFRDRHIDLGNGVLEGVEVADNVVNLIDVLLGEVLLVGGKVASENPGMDLSDNQERRDTRSRAVQATHSRVEGLDSASEHLRGMRDR